MRKFLLVLLLPFVALAATPWPPQTPPREEWHNLLMDAQKAGFLHVDIAAAEAGEVAVTLETSMRLERMGQKVQMSSTVRFVESLKGDPSAAEYTESLASSSIHTLARVVGDSLILTSQGLESADRRALFIGTAPVVFPWRADRLLAEAYARGDTLLTYRTFIPEMGQLDEFRVRLLGVEDLTVAGRRYKALRTRTSMGSFADSPTDEWRDVQTGRLVQSRIDIMGMRQETELVDQEEAQTPALGYTFDVISHTLVESERRIPHPRGVDELILHVKLREGKSLPRKRLDWPPFQSFVTAPAAMDSGQRLLLRVQRPPTPSSTYQLPYTGQDWVDERSPSLLIQAQDPDIKRIANEQTGEITDPLLAAQRLNQWVYRSMTKKGFGVGFASALEALRSKEGDCTEHALLLAALCRSAGIPARLVCGLIYVRGAFGYHMWTEVFTGQWFPLDPAFGLDSIDATHIKIATQTMAGSSTAGAFVPLLDVMGQFDLEVVEYVSGKHRFTGARPELVFDGPWVYSPEHRLRFQPPEGWETTPSEQLPEELLQVFYPRDPYSLAQITIRAFVVSYDFSLRDTERSIAAYVGGVDARQSLRFGSANGVRLSFTDPNDGLPRVSALILDGDTYFAFTVENPSSHEEKLFDAMISSIELEDPK